jgi:DNA polymerase III delta subunit
MIIFLWGPDSYRRQQKTKELIVAYRQKHPNFDFKRFDLTENPEDYLGLKDFLNQQSLFDNFKIVLVTGIFSAKGGPASGWEVEPKKIKPILKEQLTKENSALLISEEKMPSKEFDFLLEKPVWAQEFESLTAGKLTFFLRKETEKRNLNFTPEAKKYLIRWLASLSRERSGQEQTDCWALINELDKIVLAGFPQPITGKHLETLIPFSFREKIFDLARVLAGCYPLKKKLITLERLLIQKEPAAYVFNLLGYQATGSLLLQLADYDWLIKSGGLDYEEALLELVLGSK